MVKRVVDDIDEIVRAVRFDGWQATHAGGHTDLPLLAANVLQELAIENGEQGFAWPLARDELEVIARAWKKAGFSIRKLQKIVAAIPR